MNLELNILCEELLVGWPSTLHNLDFTRDDQLITPAICSQIPGEPEWDRSPSASQRCGR